MSKGLFGTFWMGNFGGSQSSASTFDPLSVFTTEDGLYFKMSADNLEKNVGGDPVTTNGDSIYLVNDLTANGYEFRVGSPGDSATWNSSEESFVVAANSYYRGVGTAAGYYFGASGSIIARARIDLGATLTDVIFGSVDASVNRCWLSCTGGVLSAGLGSIGSNSFQDSGATDLRSATNFFVGAVTWDASNQYLYLNGSEVNTASRAGTINTTADAFLAARNDQNTLVDLQYPGAISHLIAIDRKLSATEISDISNAWGWD